MSPHKIISVENPGPCAGLGIDPGDALLAVNGRPVADVFDYRMFISENPVTLTVQKKDGQCVELRAEKPENADLGLVFGSGLMDASRSCANRCVFCFIDQLPPGMRPTLYHKDDDMRLSFLSGNYVTLTNMPRSEIDRLIAHRLSPVNISVHATDPSVRVSMLKNPKAALIMENICKFSDAGIAMNFQIVLCKGINDGEVLERSVRDLAGLMRDAEPGGSRSERPARDAKTSNSRSERAARDAKTSGSRSERAAQSLSIVPAGLTKYRDALGLPRIEPHTPEDAREIAARVGRWQAEFLARYGTRFVYAADEFYVKAGLPVPPYESYEDFPQIENGVGMLAEFEREVTDALESLRSRGTRKEIAKGLKILRCAQNDGKTIDGGSFVRLDASKTAGGDSAAPESPECHAARDGQASPEDLSAPKKQASVSVVTGVAAAGFMENLCGRIETAIPWLKLRVYPVRNDFFGENVTVSGLLTGGDIAGQLKGKPLGERLLIPGNAMRFGEDVFLDDMTLEEIRKELGVEAVRTPADGGAFVRELVN